MSYNYGNYGFSPQRNYYGYQMQMASRPYSQSGSQFLQFQSMYDYNSDCFMKQPYAMGMEKHYTAEPIKAPKSFWSRLAERLFE